MSDLAGFTRTTFVHEGVARDVYRRGSGPGVLVMHEIPGITPQVATFGRRLADDGFSVFMPTLFGTPGRPLSFPYVGREFLRACIRREFHVLAAHTSSPITEWLRALARQIHAEIGGRGVGAVGMCLTGNFALTLALDDILRAPVLSQPSLPFSVGEARRRGLHLSKEGLARLQDRAATEGLRILGLRFQGDPLCPPERFETLRRDLGEAFEGIEIPSEAGNPEGNQPAHSVLTTDLIDAEGEPTRAALDRVLGFLHEELTEDNAAPH
jgi:dienelactone hydrolase